MVKNLNILGFFLCLLLAFNTQANEAHTSPHSGDSAHTAIKDVSAEVVEHAGSRIFAQAENRLHAQKALLCHLF